MEIRFLCGNGHKGPRSLQKNSFGEKVITPPEVANTGPGVNRGSGGGARGCGFEERVVVHARSGGVHFKN